MHQVQGNGRDFSTGVFLDFGGDDVHTGPAAGEDGGTWIQETTKRGIGIDR